MGLVVFTSVCGYLMAPHTIHPFLAVVGILAIALGAGSSGCLNQWYEAKSDALMLRTKNRPVASGRIPVDSALSFGLILAASSLLIMQIAFGTKSCLLLAFTIWYYAYFYTVLLKPNTDQNIVLGGAAGALPPVLGYSLVSSVDLFALSLFLIIFCWTPTHFWALSLNLKDDYAKAKIPVLPNTKGDFRTTIWIFVYAILTAIVSYIPLVLRPAAVSLWVIVSVLNIFWLMFSFRPIYNCTRKTTFPLFLYSMAYLFFLFLAFSIFL